MYLFPPAKKRIRDHRSKCFIPVGIPPRLKLKGRPVIHSTVGIAANTPPITANPLVCSISPGSSQPKISPVDFANAKFSASQSSMPGEQVSQEKCDAYRSRVLRRSELAPSSITINSRLG